MSDFSNISNIIPNPNRTDILKEISLNQYLPAYMKETEVETFVDFFEEYLNEMYEGIYREVTPISGLPEIVYELPIVWLNGSNRITSPGGSFTKFFVAGDFIKRTNENTYYRIMDVIDDSTIDLTEEYNSGTVVTFPKFYYDNFSTGVFDDFWKASDVASPDGCDGLFPILYKLDVNNNRAVCVSASSDYTQVTSGCYGNYELNFGFNLSNTGKRDNRIGFKILSTDNLYSYEVVYQSGVVSLISGTNTVASIEIDDNIYDFSCIVYRNINDKVFDFTLNGITTQTTSNWSDSVSEIPVIGFHNKWKKTLPWNVAEESNYYSLRLLTGLGQGWNFVELMADQGFKSEIDPASDTETLESLDIVRSGFWGRNYFVNAQGTFVAYIDPISNDLKVRQLSLYVASTARDARKGYTHISILEKIKRLTDLHDPDLIDIRYINYFASYLGYSIDLNNDSLLGILTSDPNYENLTNEQKEDIRQKYLRFIVTNIPHWYKIKTTNNSLNILLYSFGLAAQVKQFFTNDYTNQSAFINYDTTDVIPNTYFETPHFTIKTDLDQNINNLTADITRMEFIAKAINSVKPINTVFMGITGFVERILTPIYMNMCNSTTLHLRIGNIINPLF